MICSHILSPSKKKKPQRHIWAHPSPVFSQDEKVVPPETPWHPTQSLCVCVCVCARARACAHVCWQDIRLKRTFFINTSGYGKLEWEQYKDYRYSAHKHDQWKEYTRDAFSIQWDREHTKYVMAVWRTRRLMSKVYIHLQAIHQSILRKNHSSNRMPTHGSWKELFNSYAEIITVHTLIHLNGCSYKAITIVVVQNRPFYHTHFTITPNPTTFKTLCLSVSTFSVW